MKPIKAKIDFKYKNKFYEKGDIVEVKDYKDAIMLNEKGFIEPLTIKEISDMRNKPKKKEEEIQWQED